MSEKIKEGTGRMPAVGGATHGSAVKEIVEYLTTGNDAAAHAALP